MNNTLKHMLLVSSCLSTVCAVAEKPNIVLFLVDDLGWGDLGYNGSTFHLTPNIDAFARESTVFSDAYAYPTCSPSRACLITGQNTPRHGIYRVEAYKPAPEPYKKLRDVKSGHFYEGSAPTIGDVMKRAGYTCGYIGKWHMGDRPETMPPGRGFDVNIAGCGFGNPPSYFSPYKNPELSDGPDGEYLPERLLDETLKFINEHSTGDRPFFLIHATYLVHRPVQAKDEYTELFKTRTPDAGRSNPEYAAMVYAMDVEFGRLMQGLKNAGVFENTLIVFISDNGVNPVCAKGTPLRSCKASVYEGGIRVPMIAHWTGRTAPQVCNVPVSILDLLPTFLSAAGGTADGLTLDGENILPLFSGGTLQRDALYWHHPCYTIPTVFVENVRENYAYWDDDEMFIPPANERGDWVRPCSVIRAGDYKLIHEYETGTDELYNLKTDLGEEKNLAAELPEKVSELREKLTAWLKEMDAVIPCEPNPAYNPEYRQRPEE
ncbi:MAG: sulfatase [Kiritimatiellales bacterium]